MKRLQLLVYLMFLLNTSFAQLSNPDFFPRSVWLQSPTNAQAYKDAGINLYIGLWNELNQNQLTDLTNAGMQVICNQNNFGLTNIENTIITAWMQDDEPDNAQWNSTTQSYDPCISPAQIISNYDSIKTNDPSRPIYLNLGRGVSDINWVGRGSCTGQFLMYKEGNKGYLAGADIVSFDIYPVNNNDNIWSVPKGIDSLKSWVINPKPTWVWIETTQINGNSNRSPTPAEVKSEAWMAIIHGASGIGYFCHSWTPSFDEAALLHDTLMIKAVKEINLRIDSLAPVLNSPNTNYAKVNSSNSSVPIDIMTKSYDGYNYIFAVSMRSGITTGIFQVPAGSIIEVVGENRVLNIFEGQFKDEFSDYGVHIYRIALVSTSVENKDIAEKISIFPNPTTGEITITDGFQNSDYKIISINGQVVLKGKVIANSIDLSNLNTGMYFLEIIDIRTKNQHLFKVMKDY